jgi:hypothetical protein
MLGRRHGRRFIAEHFGVWFGAATADRHRRSAIRRAIANYQVVRAARYPGRDGLAAD